jgi:quercetin dioxygenase-like cupin family protein
MSPPTMTESATRQQILRKEVLDNAEALVVETTYPRDGETPLHQHRYPHVLYVIEGGTVETTALDGTVNTLELRPGQTFWRGPQSHSTRNIGPSTVRIVEVEIKNAAMRSTREPTPFVTTSADLEWRPDSLDPKRSMALLVGDPAKPGPYTVRMRADAGYSIRLHQHPREDENLTVLSGTLHWSTGAAGSGEPEHAAPARSFVLFPAGTPHRLWVTEETILQMTGGGPRTYVHLEPGKEPRPEP